MGQTSDDPADVTILVERFGTTSGEVGILCFPELVDLTEQVASYFVCVQLALLLIAWRTVLGHAILMSLGTLLLELSAMFGSVNADACTFNLSLLG